MGLIKEPYLNILISFLFLVQFQQMHPYFLLQNGPIVFCIRLASGMKHIFQKNSKIKFKSNQESELRSFVFCF